MRKVFLFMMVSVDGYFEGENHDISWHNVDEEFNAFAIEQAKHVDAMLFGQKTYKLMASFWPTPAGEAEEPTVAKLMNTTPKIVFSKTMDNADWENAQVVKSNVKETIEELKDHTGQDIAIYGSNNLCVSLMEEGLVDEFRIMVNPVVLGAGTPLFKGLKQQIQLKLVDTKTFKSGNLLLTYRLA